MKTMSAQRAKNALGLMIDAARLEPVLIERHGGGVVSDKYRQNAPALTWWVRLRNRLIRRRPKV